MNTRTWMIVLALLVPATTAEAQTTEADVVPFASPRWNRAAADASLVEHMGRSALLLRSGRVTLEDFDFENGIIEFDIALPRERGFVGVEWRIEGPGDFEHFYLRPHQSGNPDACQYTPVFHGVSGWQLYTGPKHTAAIPFSYDRWTRVKIVVWEGRAAIHVDSEAPRLVADLLRETHAGKVAISVPGFAPAHYSNFRVVALDEDPFESPPAPRTEQPQNVPTYWSVSSAVPEATLAGKTSLDASVLSALTWSELEPEPNGVANLARVQAVAANADTCFARVRVESDAERLVPIEFGFSDRVRVFLNGRLLFQGDDSYLTRDYRFLGTIGYFDRVVLPLREGTNEVVFAVTESFGGWGVQARFEDDAEVGFE